MGEEEVVGREWWERSSGGCRELQEGIEGMRGLGGVGGIGEVDDGGGWWLVFGGWLSMAGGGADGAAVSGWWCFWWCRVRWLGSGKVSGDCTAEKEERCVGMVHNDAALRSRKQEAGAREGGHRELHAMTLSHACQPQ